MKSYLPLLFCALVGCSLFSSAPDEGAVQVPPAPNSQVVEVQVARKRLLAALNHDPQKNRIRVVRIYARNEDISDKIPPRYRLFDVQTDSVYALLGLKVADVLISASGYAINDPQKFPRYVAALAGDKSGEIHIFREDKPLLFRYKITD